MCFFWRYDKIVIPLLSKTIPAIVMKWNELIKIAEQHGYHLVKHGKKHDRYYNPETGDEIMVERHGTQEIRKGLMMALKKRIGF